MTRGGCPMRRRGGEDGVALMLVLLLILLLAAIVAEYAYETQVEAALTANQRANLEACVAAKSAVATGLGLLEQDLYAAEESVQGVAQAAARTSGVPAEGGGDYDSWLDVWAEGLPYQGINNAVMRCTIADEFGKLNLNALLDEQGQPRPEMEQVLRYLFESLEVEQDPTDAILDWLDPDDDARPNGAESDFYLALETPYACRNGPMESIEELLLIAGITPELYFDCNRVPGEETEQPEYEGFDFLRPPSLPDLLTVFGHPQGKINVNTARPELLGPLCDALGLDGSALFEALADGNPFRSLQELQERAGIGVSAGRTAPRDPRRPEQPGDVAPREPAGRSLLDVKSNVFRIYGDGRADDVMVRIVAYVARVSGSESGAAAPDGANASGAVAEVPEGMELFRVLDWRVIQ